MTNQRCCECGEELTAMESTMHNERHEHEAINKALSSLQDVFLAMSAGDNDTARKHARRAHKVLRQSVKTNP